jgi:hypothetical protein
MSITFRPGIPFRELRRGWEAVVLPEPDHTSESPLDRAVEESSRSGSTIVVTGSFFRVQADFQTVREGNAYFSIDAAAMLGGGKIRPGMRLCNAVACSTLATAPAAWRWLLNRYLRYVASAPKQLRMGAPGAMNRRTPWVHLYTTHLHDHLLAGERFAFDRLLHSLGLLAIRRAREGADAAIRRGRIFTPDPETFPELRPDA